MMGGVLIPDNLCMKVALEAVVCSTQHDGLVTMKSMESWQGTMYTCLV